jgi:hypothetical protein
LNETEKILVEQYDCYWPRGYNRTRGGSRTFAVGKPITFDGRYYGSLSELAAEFGVDTQNVHQRVKKYGWTLRQALEIDPPREQIRTGPAKLTNVDGVTYPSFRAAAVALGIDEGQVRTRMTKYSWTMEEAFGVIPRKRANKALKAITIAGISYSSLAQAANKYGINTVAFRARMRAGWTPEQAAGLALPPDRKPTVGDAIIIQGKEFRSVKEAIRAVPHLDAGNVYARLQRGWTPEQAFGLEEKPVKIPYQAKQITLGGQTYRSMRDAAQSFGLAPQLVSKRYRLWGWSLEQAFGLVPPPRRTSRAKARSDGGVSIQGTRYDSLAHACEELNRSYSSVTSRLKRGWTIEEAVGLVYRKPKTRRQ